MNNSKIPLIICCLAGGITRFPDKAISFEQSSIDFAISKEDWVGRKKLNIQNTEQFKISQSLEKPVDEFSMDGNTMGQVNSVSQFRDVQPTDWAFQALQSLVERY